MMTQRALRVVVFAPHFSEYSTRLATALSARAEVLLVAEARNIEAECAGLVFGAPPTLRRETYVSDYALRRMSLRGLQETRRVDRAIAAFRPDICHFQEQGDHFTASLAAELSRTCPIVLTVHDPVPHTGNDALVAKHFAQGLLQLRAAASAYHVHGSHCEAILTSVVGTSKPIVSTAHGAILIPPADLVDGGDRYLFFGRMEAYKGLDTLLDAIDLLPASSNLRFVFAGRGPELDRCRARIAAQPSIELIERFLQPLEAIREFQRARVVLVPYRDATQSGVISAAVGNGKPVIASAVGGLIDALGSGENGLLVPPNDPVALASAILSLTDDAVCQRLTNAARIAATGRFAWATIANRLHTLYADVLADRIGRVGSPPSDGP